MTGFLAVGKHRLGVGRSPDVGRSQAHVGASYQAAGMFSPHCACTHGLARLPACGSIYATPSSSSINSSPSAFLTHYPIPNAIFLYNN